MVGSFEVGNKATGFVKEAVICLTNEVIVSDQRCSRKTWFLDLINPLALEMDI